MSGFVVRGLDPAPFLPLYGLADRDLANLGVRRMVVDAQPGFPCRITLEDAPPGATVLLLNHEHQPARTPYRQRHAIFVQEGAQHAAEIRDAVPRQLAIRPISLRAYDDAGMMIDAGLVDGTALGPLIERYLADPQVAYLHAHNAVRGCFAARIERG